MRDKSVINVIKEIEESIENGDTNNREFLNKVESICFILEEMLKENKKDY